MQMTYDMAIEDPMATDEYTIDELSAATHVPSRTIRFYQSKGALTKPEIRGRVAIYSKAHVERLRLIAKLQDQGLRIKAIRDLLARVDRDELDLGDWLGLKAQLQTPWADDSPIMVTEDQLFELVGQRREGLLGELLRLKLVKKERDAYSVRSPSLLSVSMRLEQAGFDLETSVTSAKTLRKHIGRAAKEVSEHFLTHLRTHMTKSLKRRMLPRHS
jgi:DNA-binding transcriptional MerR regulator